MYRSALPLILSNKCKQITSRIHTLICFQFRVTGNDGSFLFIPLFFLFLSLFFLYYSFNQGHSPILNLWFPITQSHHPFMTEPGLRGCSDGTGIHECTKAWTQEPGMNGYYSISWKFLFTHSVVLVPCPLPHVPTRNQHLYKSIIFIKST